MTVLTASFVQIPDVVAMPAMGVSTSSASCGAMRSELVGAAWARLQLPAPFTPSSVLFLRCPLPPPPQ